MMDFIILIPTAVASIVGYLYVTGQSDLRARITKLEESQKSNLIIHSKLDKDIGILQSQNASQLREVEKLETQLDDIRDYR
jgi:hypothetical protein